MLMLSSIRFRLWLTYVLVAVVMLFITGLAVGVFLIRNPVQDRRELQRLRIVSDLAAQRNQLINLDADIQAIRFKAGLKRLDHLSEARLAVFSSEGKLLADSRSDSASPLPEWSYFENRPPGAGSIFRDATNRQWIFVTSALNSGGKLLVTAPRPPLRIPAIIRDDFVSPFLKGGVLGLGLTIILSIWIAGWIAAPLKHLKEGAQQVSRGDFRKVPIEGPEEVQAIYDKVQSCQLSGFAAMSRMNSTCLYPGLCKAILMEYDLDSAAFDPIRIKLGQQVLILNR